MSRKTRWCFTINSGKQASEEVLKGIYESLFALKEKPLGIGYMVYQLERGEEGTLHIQGYIEYDKKDKNGKSLERTKTILGCTWAHLEGAMGNEQQCTAYCTKEESRVSGPIIWGTPRPGQGYRSDLVALSEKIKGGSNLHQLKEENAVDIIKYSKGIKELKFLVDKENSKHREDIKVEVYVGDAGSGKTYKAFKENEDSIYRLSKGNNANLWFDGYDGEKCLLIEEFDGYIRIDVLFQILDHYQYKIEMKGASTYANWTKVILTSNIPVDKWYPSILPEHEKALLRRLTKVLQFELPKNIPLNNEMYKSAKITEIDISNIFKKYNDPMDTPYKSGS